MAEFTERYVILVISEDGLLKHPKTWTGDFRFNRYGYIDEVKAKEAIEIYGFTQECAIVKLVVLKTW